jgi:hypothetical protein
MRLLLLSCCVAAILSVQVTLGRADMDVDSLLDKAIKAHGGEEALAKCKAVHVKMKVNYEGAADVYAQEWLFAAPDKLRHSAEGTYLGRRTVSIYATDGKVAWSLVNGQVETLEGDFAQWYKDQAHLMQAARLTPLKAKECELKAVGETKVDGKTALGLQVRAKGHKDLTLFFDAESGLLVKIERKVRDSDGQEVKEERFYQDYPKKDGLPYARKVIVKQDGKTVETDEVHDVKFLEKADDKEFRRK